MTDTIPAIHTVNVTKSFGSTVAITDLSLTIEPGTIYGFLGPNGAGKTTTMRMLARLSSPLHETLGIIDSELGPIGTETLRSSVPTCSGTERSMSLQNRLNSTDL